MTHPSHTTATVTVHVPQNLPPETTFQDVVNATTDWGSTNTVTLTHADGTTSEITGEGVTILGLSPDEEPNPSEHPHSDSGDTSVTIGERLAQAVNTRVDADQFNTDVKSMHNAIQRYLFRQILKPGIIALAETEQTDARNNQVVTTCRRICEAENWDVTLPSDR